jgi:hypothetical protein
VKGDFIALSSVSEGFKHLSSLHYMRLNRPRHAV